MITRCYRMLLVAVMSAIGIVAGAKSLAPAVTGIALYGSDNHWDEPMEQFSKVGDDVWQLSDVTIYGGTEFKLKLHINFNGEEWDEWYGSTTDGVETLKSAAPGTVVECDIRDGAPNFLIGHTGEFTFTMTYDDIDQLQFQFEGMFEEARYLTGEFNNWGEKQFTAWVGEYTLDFEEGWDQPISGQFLIVDQDYNYLGGVTDGEYYTITRDNPTLQLATDAQDKKNLYLADEGYYSFVVTDDNELTVSNWPVEVITASLVGSTQPGWDMSNATIIPLTLDSETGFFTNKQVPIPAGFNCQVLRHSSLSSVADAWYGGTSGTGVTEVPDSGDEFDLMPTTGDDFTFTGNGTFSFWLEQDFSSIRIYGIYENDPSYFLTGEFNNWGRDGDNVPFVKADGESTLTHTFSGEFLIVDNYGNLLGGATDENHYWLHEDWPSVRLFTDLQAPNKKNIYVKDESEYTLTIENCELTVSGWPVETLSVWLMGATDDQWEGNELNFQLTKDESTGNYVLGQTDIPAGYRFQVVLRSSLSSVADVWYGAQADGDMYHVNEEVLGNIALGFNNKDIYFDRGGRFTFTVSPNCLNVNIQGDFEPKLYFLIGDFNDWDEDSMVPFVMKDGELSLTMTLCGDFLIKDHDGNWIGANIGGDSPHMVFTANGNNVAITSNADKKNFCVELPSEYTLTLDSEMLFVTGFPTGGFYICGDFNGWRPELMTAGGDGTHSLVLTISENDQFKFRDHEAYWYGGDTGGEGDTYEIHRDWCSDIPLTKGDNGSNFIIKSDGNYKFVITEGDGNPTLSVVGLGFIHLADALEGISGQIEDDLFVAAIRPNSQEAYVSNGEDWVCLEGGYNTEDLQPGYCVNLSEMFCESVSDKDTAPTIVINDFYNNIYSDEPQIPEIIEIDLSKSFEMPKLSQVVKFKGVYYDGQLRGYSGNNGGKGQSINLDFLNNDPSVMGFTNGAYVSVTAAVMLQEPWQNAPRRARSSFEYDFQNIVARVLADAEDATTTGVATVTADATVVDTRYYNLTGQQLTAPTAGVTIVVTRYSDGSVTSVKVVK